MKVDPVGGFDFLRSVAQPGRALALGASRRRFESGYSDLFLGPTRRFLAQNDPQNRYQCPGQTFKNGTDRRFLLTPDR